MAEELITLFTAAIESLTLIPSSGGRFEVKVDDALIYSKKASGRHAEAGEVAHLFQAKTGIAPKPRN